MCLGSFHAPWKSCSPEWHEWENESMVKGAKESILSPFLASCWSFLLVFPLSCSRSPLLPVPALISSALTQSLVSLCLFPAKPFPLGLLPAGPDRRLSKGKCLHTSSPFPFLAAAWCIPSSQPHSRHTSPGDGLGSISSRLEYLLLRLSPANSLLLHSRKGHQILQDLLFPLTVPEETSALYSHLGNLGLAVIFCLISFPSRGRKRKIAWEGEKGRTALGVNENPCVKQEIWI